MPHLPFVHLHVHSYYSFLEGLAAPAELVQAAARHGMPALALTDRIGLSGAIEFYRACQEAGIRPILGLEAPVAWVLDLVTVQGDLVLLATNRAGWSSLCRLSSFLLTDLAGAPERSLPLEILSRESEGLLCLTGGARGALANLLREGLETAAAHYLSQLSQIYSGRVYVELQQQVPEDRSLSLAMARLGSKARLPVIASHGIYYLDPGPAGPARQRLATAVRLLRRLDEVPEEACAPPGSHFISPEEMAARFADFPDALAATLEVADRCRLDLPLGKPLFPEVDLPAGQSAMQVLEQKATAGAQARYGEVSEAVQARLNTELAVIESKGYATLFLIMEEILDFARRQGVPISSRGSAASSLVAYCLEITTPDPLRLNLFFERFLNPARASSPDIDTDLCSRRRDEVIRFVYERFGADRVAMVGTINSFRPRSALRETAKAHGLSGSEISRLVEALPWRWRSSGHAGESPYAELAAKEFRGKRFQAIFSDAETLIGLPRHLSIHPGGVVIAPGQLTDICPTQKASKGIVITQFDLESIAHLGLVKIDLLGIRGLSVLGDTAAALRARDPAAYPEPLSPLEAIPDHDPMTADLVGAGRTIGCFQIESPGMRATLKEVQARCIDDVMVALALYRPGPLTGGLKDAFVRRHRGMEEVSYLHPALSEVLAETHGVILYQEQVLRIAHELAGLSLADADLLRRAMSHFDPGEQMQTLKERFLAGAAQRAAMPEEIAERTWELMAAFAGYGFPKAHSASYAQIAWQSAWCKAHAPEIFMAAVLANWGGYYSQRYYLTEARRMGLALRPPQVNFAGREFSVAYVEDRPTLYMGLDQVRDLTRRTQERILRERPFHSLADFLARVDPRQVEATNLIRCGALAGFGEIPRLLGKLAGSNALDWRGGQLPLFTFDDENIQAEDWTLEEKVAAQISILGVGVDAHPLELVADQIAEAGAITTAQAAESVGLQIRVAGMRFSGRRSRDAHGKYVYVMSLEDLESMVDVIVPQQIYDRSRSVFSEDKPMIVEGEVALDAERGEPIIRAQKLWRLN